MTAPLEDLRKEFRVEKTDACVQCGYCLPVCPTYQTMGKETHSPRGRINLVKMVGEGKIQDLSLLEEPLDLCLGCRACETACPTGVEYGSILEAARLALTRRKSYSLSAKLIRRTFLRTLITNRRVMRSIGAGLWLYQKTGLQSIVRKTAAGKLLPRHLKSFEATLPELPSPWERAQFPKHVEPKGARKYTVALFTGCIMDALFLRIHHLAIQLLAEVGCEVVVVDGQTCCGALHAHAGERGQAMALAKQNISAFERTNADFIVIDAGGCGAALSEYAHLFEDDPQWSDRAKRFVAHCRDISQILDLCGGVPMKCRPAGRVTYQPSCHLTNVQKVTKEPLALLRGASGENFAALREANMCCGSAGIYNIVHYDESMEILHRKMAAIREARAQIIVTTNPGCLLQMRLGVEQEQLQGIRVLHLVEYLAEAAGLASDSK